MPGKNLTRSEAQERAALLTVATYSVHLDLTGAGDTFRSVSEISFDCRTPGAETFLDLIAPRVTRVTLNGAELDPAEVFGDCRVRLPNLAAHNTVVVEADAEWSHTGEGLHRFTDPVDHQTYCYSQFEVADARCVFANFEQPDLKAEFTFAVTAPDGWTVWSNQPVAGLDGAADHATTWRFEPTPRMSTYLAAFVAGPYTAWHDTYRSADGRDVPLSVLVRASMAQFLDADAIFAVTKQGFAFYERSFGVPYPYAKYDQAFVPEYNAGAMENIGLVTITEAYVFRSKPTQAMVDRRAITVLHEQAHMWFGDLVTMRWWDDLWLNESFAEFASHLAAVENTRWTDAWTTFLASEKSWALNQDQLPSTHPIVADIRDLADVEVNFDGITYAKGASVLRQLVAWVGQDQFLAGVSAYLKKHAYGNATLADLLAELEAASGRDLTDWSRQWLQEAGVTLLRPEIEVAATPVELPAEAAALAAAWERPTAVDQIERLTLRQEVPAIYAENARDAGGPLVTPSLRPQRLRVAGYLLGEKTLRELWSCEVDVVGPATVVAAAAGQPRPDLLLVNDGDLGYAKVRLDSVSLANVTEHLADIADPLARGLVWAALWDAVRDGELPGTQFVQAVLGAVSQETSPTTVSTLFNQLRTTLAYYVAPEHRDEVERATADKIMDLAIAAVVPGGDTQLQMIKTAALIINDDEMGEEIANFLDGIIIPGLVVDTDLRWELLQCAVANGQRGEDAIAAELQRDPTTRGHELAAGVRAARPQAEAKMAAWIAALTDETITNGTQRAIIAGFNRVRDRSLLLGFVEPYFAELEKVWASRSREMATNVVEGLYPIAALNDVDVVAATDAWLEQLGDRTPALRRLVTERRAAVVRALKAQAADRATLTPA
ncbi:MAG: aminopeptidase N [Propionibacteriaceae bacterium]|jgi:aminopeptidase N|nr:aminopeptidase N [Propionibacteriaceae bacterium]